jgi:hypothetical protein
MVLLGSPRARRRLGWAGGTALAAAAAVAVVVLLPEGRRIGPTAADVAVRPPLPTVERHVKTELTPAMRAEINETLARFIRAAVEREDPALAWELSGPSLRAGWTLQDWKRGQIPVFPFEPRHEERRHMRKLYAYEDKVGFDIILQPRRRDQGAMAVTVDVVRQRGRWLVDTWTTAALFTPPEGRQWVTGVVDYSAGGFTDKSYKGKSPIGESRIDPTWLLAPVALIGLVLLVPAGLGVAALRRRRRLRAGYGRRPLVS